MGESGSREAATHDSGGAFSDRVIRISGATARPAAVAGGKAANLIALAAAGFPVPDGIVVPVSEYMGFLSAGGLKDRIVGRLDATDFTDRGSIAACSADIKAMIGGSSLDSALAAAISTALAGIGGSLWAVRSSALAEDLEDASFAGQQDTYLNVRAEDVAVQVVRCWTSYWNERAIAYRHLAGVPQFEGGMAVVIQHMADAAVAGVLHRRPRGGHGRPRGHRVELGAGRGHRFGHREPGHVRLRPAHH